MYGRNIEPTTRDIIGALADHGTSDETDRSARMQGEPFDVSRFGTVTQRAMILATAVREAEDRAAVAYAALLRDTYTASDTGCGTCGHLFDHHSINNSGCGCDFGCGD